MSAPGRTPDQQVAMSTLIDTLNERFRTDFNKADQLFFDQIRATAEADEKIVEAVRAHNFKNFESFLERALDELFIDRMEGNEEIFSRVMTDKEFRGSCPRSWCMRRPRAAGGDAGGHRRSSE
jgi:type I restriction enzyme R subunit